MIKLELFDFKCHTHSTFEFPNHGVCLIKGKSGNGKSSILDALYFVLYGLGNKLTKFGKKKCQVNYSDDQFNIVRTKTPNHLTLTLTSGELYNDQTAQALINSRFGDKHFCITSYLMQNGSSFINLSASEKIHFLEQVAFDNENIMKIKTKVKEDLKLLSSQNIEINTRLLCLNEQSRELPVSPLTIVDASINSLDKQLAETENEFFTGNKSLEMLQNSYDCLQVKIRKCEGDEELQSFVQSQLKKYIDELTHIKQSIDQSLYYGDDKVNQIKIHISHLQKHVEVDKLQENVNNMELQVEKLQKDEFAQMQQIEDETRVEIRSAQKNVCMLIYGNTENIFDKHNVLSELTKLTGLHEQWVSNTKLQSKATDVETQLDRLKDSQSIIDEIQVKLINLEKEDVAIKQFQSILICPACNASLRQSDSKLTQITSDLLQKSPARTTAMIDIDIKNTKQALKTAQNNVWKHEQLMHELKRTTQAIKPIICGKYLNPIQLKQDIEKISAFIASIGVLENKLLDVEHRKNDCIYSISLTKLMDTVKSNRIKLHRLQTDTQFEYNREVNIDKLQLEYAEQIAAKSKYYDSINRQAVLHNEINRCEQKLNTILETNDSLTPGECKVKCSQEAAIIHQQKCSMQSKVELLAKKVKIINENIVYVKNTSEYNEWLQNKIALQTQINETNNQVYLLDTFLKKISQAEGVALTSLVESLNSLINLYLTQFFVDNDISVQLNIFKESKKDIKTLVNISVFYRNEEFDLHSLSGGEFDRVQLAMQLAFNSVYSSNIIMLDESISSLDSDLTNHIVQQLKHLFPKKLILIVGHQIVEGLFDFVVSV